VSLFENQNEKRLLHFSKLLINQSKIT